MIWLDWLFTSGAKPPRAPREYTSGYQVYLKRLEEIRAAGDYPRVLWRYSTETPDAHYRRKIAEGMGTRA